MSDHTHHHGSHGTTDVKAKSAQQHYHHHGPTLDPNSKWNWFFKNRDLYLAVICIVLVIPMWAVMGKGNVLMPTLGNPLIQLVLGTIVQLILAFPMFISWYHEIVKTRKPGMFTLIMISSLTSYFYSLYLIIATATSGTAGFDSVFGLFQGKDLTYLASYKMQSMFFEVGATIIAFVYLGEGISAYIRNRSFDGLKSLLELQVKTTTLILPNHKQKTIEATDIKLNDVLLVRKGEKIPTDGILIDELAYLNESLLTGESHVIKKTKNESILGGTINAGEAFVMQATKIGKDTILANIIAKVTELQTQKSALEKVADKISNWFTPIVIVIAFLTFIMYAWILRAVGLTFLIDNPYGVAIRATIAVLIIACPCALGLATPLASSVGILKAVREGILFNNADAFEKIKGIDIVAFDKTGTITEGKLSIKEILGDTHYLDVAMTLENMSSHPIAEAFHNYAQEYNISKTSVTDIKEIIGFGMQGQFKDKRVVLSSVHKLLEKNYVLSDKLNHAVSTSKKQLQLILGLAINNEVTTLFVLQDQIKLTAIEGVARLQSVGIEVYMISGDNEVITKNIAEQVNIKHYFAGVDPLKKADIVRKLQVSGKKVAFVGDGVNDSVALKQADLSLAMSQGSDVAINISDVVIIKPDINNIYKGLIVTKQTRRAIYINFLLAFLYNVLAIPIAVLSGWYWEIGVQNVSFAIVAAAAMALSSISVVLYTLYYRWKKIRM